MQFWRLASPKSSGLCVSVETLGRADVAVQVERLFAGRMHSCSEEVSFILFRLSTDWMQPT